MSIFSDFWDNPYQDNVSEIDTVRVETVEADKETAEIEMILENGRVKSFREKYRGLAMSAKYAKYLFQGVALVGETGFFAYVYTFMLSDLLGRETALIIGVCVGFMTALLIERFK